MTRPQAACAGCGESVDAPDSPMGHAIVAAFEDQHRGHAKTEEPVWGFWKIPGRVKPGDRIDGDDLARILDTAPEGTVVRLPDTVEVTMRHALHYCWRGDDDGVFTSVQLAAEIDGPLTVVSIGEENP